MNVIRKTDATCLVELSSAIQDDVKFIVDLTKVIVVKRASHIVAIVDCIEDQVDNCNLLYVKESYEEIIEALK